MNTIKKIVAITLLGAVLLTGCNGGGSKKLDVKELAKEMVAATKFEDEMIELGSDLISNYYETENMESYSVYICPTGGFAEEIAVIKAKSGKVEDVKSAVQKHITARKTEFDGYVPKEVEKLTAAAVLTNGDYVTVVIAGDTQPAKDIFDKAFAK